MPHRYFAQQVRGADAFLSPADSRHLCVVLRGRPGEEVTLSLIHILIGIQVNGPMLFFEIRHQGFDEAFHLPVLGAPFAVRNVLQFVG